MKVWIGMTGGMAKHWIIPRVGDKELPRVGHQLASCSLLISYVLKVWSCRNSERYGIWDGVRLGRDI